MHAERGIQFATNVHSVAYIYCVFRVFAANICDKISDMIHSVATPVKLKLSLIPVLQYMHHDVTMATKVCMIIQNRYLNFIFHVS